MPATDPHVRAGSPADAPALYALYVQAFRDSTLPFTVYVDRRSVAWMAEVLARTPPVVGVTERDGDLLGAFEGASSGDEWHLNHVAARADARGQGLGDRLLTTFEAWGRERGAARFSLHVVEKKADVVAWYARRGYRAEARRVHVALAILSSTPLAPTFAPDPHGYAAALASVQRQGFGRFAASRGDQRIEVGLVGDDACRLLDAGALSVEEAVAEVRALFAGRRRRLVLVGQPREPQVDGVLEAWPAWRMVKDVGAAT